MPQAVIPFIPAIAGGIGALFGAGGGSGRQQSNQGSSQTQGQSQTTGSNQYSTGMTGTTQNQYGGTSTPVQSQAMTDLRNNMAKQLQGLQANANIPVYGQPELAKFMNDQNDVTNSALAGVKQQLAAGGQLNSGSLANAVSALNVGRLGNIAGYQMQTPLANRMAASQLMNPLLQQTNSLLATAPTGQVTSGQSTGQTSQTGTGMGTSQQNTNYNQVMQQLSQLFGPSFGSGLMNNLGGMFGQMASGQGPFGKIFGGNTQQDPFSGQGVISNYPGGYGIPSDFGAGGENPF